MFTAVSVRRETQVMSGSGAHCAVPQSLTAGSEPTGPCWPWTQPKHIFHE